MSVFDTQRTDTIFGVVSITKSDTATVDPRYAQAVGATGAGDVALVLADGSTFVVTLTAGQMIKASFTKVKSTGTTATGIFGIRLIPWRDNL